MNRSGWTPDEVLLYLLAAAWLVMVASRAWWLRRALERQASLGRVGLLDPPGAWRRIGVAVISGCYLLSGTFAILAASLMILLGGSMEIFMEPPMLGQGFWSGVLMVVYLTLTIINIVRWLGKTASEYERRGSQATMKSEAGSQGLWRVLHPPVGVALVLILVASLKTLVTGLDDPLDMYMRPWLIAVIGQGLILIGLAFQAAMALLRLPVAQIDGIDLRTFRTLMQLLAWLHFGLACLMFSILGIVFFFLFLGFAWVSGRGRKETRQFGTLSLLAGSVSRAAPLGEELRRQVDVVDLASAQRLLGLAHDLDEGDEPRVAICRWDVVPETSRFEVCTADDAGLLAAGLRHAVAHERERLERSRELADARGWWVYFSAVLTITGIMLGFLGYYIVPKFKRILADFDFAPPSMAQVALTSLDDMSLIWVLWWVSCFSGTGLLILKSLSVSYAWRRPVEWFGFRWGARGWAPDLLRSLRWVVLGNRPLDQALEALAVAPHPFAMRSQLHQAAAKVRQGHDPWQSLADTRWLLPREVELLQTAQSVGNLPWALDTLSQSLEAGQVARQLWWAQTLQLVMTVLLGGVIGFVALGLIGPFFLMITFF
jgi:type IV pilus assembly protein PilC